MRIKSLIDPTDFKKRRKEAWEKNIIYWLKGPLRHVDDIGKDLVNNILKIIAENKIQNLRILDMGFGNAWLLEELLAQGIDFHYVGIDLNIGFVKNAKNKYSHLSFVDFVQGDLDEPFKLDFKADIVVNSFSFLEQYNLREGMANAYRYLSHKGSIIVATIDKTFLIFALSNTMKEFKENLSLYQTLPGVKYGFQPIDLGTYASKTLEYPSVLYSFDNYLKISSEFNLSLIDYREFVFTSKPIPKIYLIFELSYL